MEALILSTGLDTNGQNTRYARAADKFGGDPDVLKVMAIGSDDPAGVVGRFQAAAAKGDSLRIRSAHKTEHYFKYPRDMLWTRETEPEIRRMAHEADVIHLNNSYRAYTYFRLRKPALLHHHGSLFRNNPAAMLQAAKYHRMTQAVSTVDLMKPAPDILHWLPTAYDLDELAAIGRANRREPDGRVRIVSCPTNRKLKATEELIAAVKTLQGEGLPVDLMLVEGQSWTEALKVKATADIYFDQVAFGYGCNSIEAWAMGIPSVAGAEDLWVLAKMAEMWGGDTLPFYLTEVGSIAWSMRQLVTQPDLRAEWAAKGLAHAQRYHAEKPALERLAELYALTIRNYESARAAVQPVVFRSNGRPVWLDGQRLDFVDGVYSATDPVIVSRLRYFAEKRPVYGITEVKA